MNTDSIARLVGTFPFGPAAISALVVDRLGGHWLLWAAGAALVGDIWRYRRWRVRQTQKAEQDKLRTIS